MISKTLKSFRDLWQMFADTWWLWAAIGLFMLIVAGGAFLFATYVLGVK